jgi:chromosome segregation ATPase
MELLEINNITKLLSYFITVIIGGVGYKFISLFTKYKTDSKVSDLQNSKMLIDSLMTQMETMTTRITMLEQEREKYHQREVEIIKQFTESKVRVSDLEKQVEKLEAGYKSVKKDLETYRQKYGHLDT